MRFYLAKSLALDGTFSIDRYYRGGYRGDRVDYGRDTYADLDVVIHVPLW